MKLAVNLVINLVVNLEVKLVVKLVAKLVNATTSSHPQQTSSHPQQRLDLRAHPQHRFGHGGLVSSIEV